MAAPANNPFGTPLAQVGNNPFGAPASAPGVENPFGVPAAKKNPFAAPVANPFGAPANNPFGAPVNNPFGAPASASRPSSAGNPFGAPSGQTSALGTPSSSAAPSRQPSPSVTQNPFGKPPGQAQPTNPFGSAEGVAGSGSTPSPFGAPAQPAATSKGPQAFGPADASAMGGGRRNKPEPGRPSGPGDNSSSGFGGRGQAQGPQRNTPFAGSKASARPPAGPAAETSSRSQPGGRNKQAGRQERYQPPPGRRAKQTVPGAGPTERTKELSGFAFDYANKLYDHLRKENINPPTWPAEPGDPNKRGAIENLKDAYKKYRSRVYASLRKADLIDDPEKRRKLEDALPFKGICEDMCPEFEKVSRIAEYDVKTEEKETRPDGLTMWPEPSRMVKKFGRSAAGQDAPLPMDVRSVDALRRTTDYLFTDLLQSESNLPSMHNFLWDRTRAVRRDFTFHSQKSAEEMKEMVYCFETITRFHATALHLLSKKGFANEDFDQKQEIEQLGRTILSLIEAYDVCRAKRVHCDNEPEFRAYYLLLNAHDPSIARRIPAWGKEYWFESEEVQTALSLIRAMDDVRELKGPIKPRRPTALSDTSFTNYFSIVEDPRVSYTMACVAEIHFTTVRQGILRNLVRGYARYRDAPRTITASDLNAMLRFDTTEEAIEFAELHDFELSTWVPEGKNPVSEPYLLLNNKKKVVPSPRVRQSFSGRLVERKRTAQSLTHVIYNTVFEEPGEKPPEDGEKSPDGLFVTQTSPPELLGPSTNLQPAAPASSLFGTAAATPSPFANAIPPWQAPAAPAGSTAPGFQTLQSSSTTAPGLFAAFGQPAEQAPAAKSPFSFLKESPAQPPADTAPKIGSVFGRPVEPAKGAHTSLTSNPPDASNPFAFLDKLAAAKQPSAPRVLQPSSTTTTSSIAPPTGSTTLGAASLPAPAQSSTAGQAKSAGVTPPSSLPVSAPLAGATPSLAAATGSQSVSGAPAAPSILVTPPSSTSKPTGPGQPIHSTSAPQLLGSERILGSSSGSRTPSRSAPSPAPAAAPVPSPPAKRDLIGDFTTWFVKGDDGLLEHFTEETLRNMLWDVWQSFGREEVERKRKEEDEESWRLAREHQTRRLRVKYFYRWRNNARSLATRRILREGKERMRAYRAQQQAIRKQQQEEKEKAEREARRAAKRQLMEDAHRLSLLASSAHRRGSVAYSAGHSPEDQLLASGVFSGLRDDPRAIARRVVREAMANGDASPTASAARSYRYPDSTLDLDLGPATSPRGSVASTDTGSVGRREGWKTRSLREKFGIEPRRSLSASGSVANGGSFTSSTRFRQSLPGTKTTTFSRKRSALESSDEERDAKRQSVYYGSSSSLLNLNHSTAGPKANSSNGFFRSRHWDLRARGLVPMPDGNWLPEAMAKPVAIAAAAAAAAAASSSSSSPPLRPPTLPRLSAFSAGSGSPPPAEDDPDFVIADADAEADDDGGGGGGGGAFSEVGSMGSARAASPTPTPVSDWRLRLARLARPRPLGLRAGLGRTSVDLGRPAGAGADAYAGAGIGVGGQTGGERLVDGAIAKGRAAVGAAGMGKRKRGVGSLEGDGDAGGISRGLWLGGREMEGLEGGEGRPERPLSPLSRKKANVDGAATGGDGAAGCGDVPGREETSAMVENTRRMLRELREFMDRVEREDRRGSTGLALG